MTRLIVNGEPRQTQAADLAALLDELGFAEVVVATALNGEFVPATARARQPVADGDQIEVLAPMQGG